MTPQSQAQPQQAAALPAASPSLLDAIVEQQARKQADVASRYKPVMNPVEMVEREAAIDYLKDVIMKDGVDYGYPPGTAPDPDKPPKPGEYVPKPSLFKAGAERACAYFGYYPHYEFIEKIEDWARDNDDREMLFYYVIRCTLFKDGAPVGEGIGSGTTWESKYRYRFSERTCPACGKENIRRSKPKANQQGEPGWYCWDRTGGCGANFAADEPAIVDQVVGKVPNPDIADAINTVYKMAQKRAYVAATLSATGLSSRFTQDLEDMSDEQREDLIRRRTAEEQAKLNHQQQRQQGGQQQGAQRQNGGRQQQQTAGNNRQQQQAPPPSQQHTGSVEPEVEALWKRMTDFDTFLAAFEGLKHDIKETFGDTEIYYRILAESGMQHANDIKKIGRDKARQAAAKLLRMILAEHKAAAEAAAAPTAPAPAASPGQAKPDPDKFEASDDDLPTNLGGNYDPPPNPAEARRMHQPAEFRG